MTKEQLKRYPTMKSASGGMGIPLGAFRAVKEKGSGAFRMNGNVDGEQFWEDFLELAEIDGFHPAANPFGIAVTLEDTFYASRLWLGEKAARLVKTRLLKIYRLQREVCEIVGAEPPREPVFSFEKNPEEELGMLDVAYWGT